jgi:hypothetical protein
MIVLFSVLSFFMPLVGWILFCVTRESQPKSALSAGAFGTLGFLLVLLLVVLVTEPAVK